MHDQTPAFDGHERRTLTETAAPSPRSCQGLHRLATGSQEGGRAAEGDVGSRKHATMREARGGVRVCACFLL